ncbi:General transcriptional corepressor ssn6 [Fusarium acutatum]|uniref:General transcriptional corepressor ssn6 n=1 Tax=Fusarium acutatum TaxID=78861 RepID=A0A8H4K1E6_9HYPO|nr:General transcriptional corepressor ssn6 [Fusarium acutatum]
MSFGYRVGDVIAVLGLFERIAIELRKCKDAPTQFQQLSAEIDLLRGTLNRVLSLEPESDTERETLEQIRAIVIYCAQPLQSMADKMRSKETSLGHFKTTRSLDSIGTRLHWSMIGLNDVQELRKTVMSQMAAIDVLLSVQQQSDSHEPERRSWTTDSCIGPASDVSLQSLATGAARRYFGDKYNYADRNAIKAGKRDKPKLDRDGAELAQPGKDILQFVVYAKERPGAKYISHNLFAVAQAKIGKEVNQETWKTIIKPGFHLEQAVVLKVNWWSQRCLDPNCTGKLVDQALEFETRKICDICYRSTKSTLVPTRLVNLYNEAPYWHHPVKQFTSHTRIHLKKRRIFLKDGTIAENWYMLSRACMTIEDYERAYESLEPAISLEPLCPSFWITLGILYFNIGQSRHCLHALTKVVELNAHLWEPWYNLGVLYDSYNGQHSEAADAFHKCLEREPDLPNLRARLEAQQSYARNCNDEPLGGNLIYKMVESPLDGVQTWWRKPAAQIPCLTRCMCFSSKIMTVKQTEVTLK